MVKVKRKTEQTLKSEYHFEIKFILSELVTPNENRHTTQYDDLVVAVKNECALIFLDPVVIMLFLVQ